MILCWLCTHAICSMLYHSKWSGDEIRIYIYIYILYSKGLHLWYDNTSSSCIKTLFSYFCKLEIIFNVDINCFECVKFATLYSVFFSKAYSGYMIWMSCKNPELWRIRVLCLNGIVQCLLKVQRTYYITILISYLKLCFCRNQLKNQAPYATLYNETLITPDLRIRL